LKSFNAISERERERKKETHLAAKERVYIQRSGAKVFSPFLSLSGFRQGIKRVKNYPLEDINMRFKKCAPPLSECGGCSDKEEHTYRLYQVHNVNL